jgi:hypothetical protein
MDLTREVSPSSRSVFNFAAPDRDVFVSFIASADGLTTDEVHDRTAGLMTKLGARNRVELAIWAYETGRKR